MSLRGAIATWQPHAYISERVRLPRYARNDMCLLHNEHSTLTITWLFINVSTKRAAHKAALGIYKLSYSYNAVVFRLSTGVLFIGVSQLIAGLANLMLSPRVTFAASIFFLASAFLAGFIAAINFF
jgi:hypothetical protein